MEENNRWEINKLNVVNYWKFVNETFYFKKGKIFFNGSNGSGKSNLTQLFPFVLDGNYKQGRLDASGNKEKRRMEYYFKPKDEKGEIISGVNGEYGYICVEYKKRKTEQYLTVCIGMKYTVNNSNDESLKFNAFILKDGRRVGKDFILFKKENGNIIPYEFKDLEKELNLKKENVYNTRDSYINAINKELFGFEDKQQLKELCNIILQIRNAQFTGKTKVSEIKDKIMDSLPTLDEEEFENFSNSFQELEDNKQILEEFEEDKKLIFDLNEKYNVYNQAILYNKYKEYLEKVDSYKKTSNYLKSLEKKLSELQENNELLIEEIKKIEDDEINYEIQISTLEQAKEIKDIKQFKEQIIDLKKELTKLTENFQENNKNIDIKENEILKLQEEINTLEKNKVENRSKRAKIYKELNEKNLEIKFRGHLDNTEYQYIDSSIEKLKEKLNHSKEEVYNYQNDIFDCARLLQDFEETKRNFNDVKEKFEEIKDQIKLYKSKIDKLEEEKVEEKTNIINLYYDISNSNKFLKISDDSLKEIERKINLYEQFTDDEIEYIDNIRKNFYRKKEKELQNKINDINLEIKENNKFLTNIKDQLKELKNKKDKNPDRKKEERLCRKELENQGIKFISLYEGIDFTKDLSLNESILLESQLIDSGILDSLIIPYSQYEKAKEILKVYPCLALTPSFKKNSTFNKLILENIDDEFKEVINDFLESISVNKDDKESQYVISDNGYFRNGALEGYSVISNKKNNPIYIGFKRRQAELKKDIENKEKERINLENIIGELTQEIKELEFNIDELENENKKFPQFKKILEIILGLKNNNNFLKKYDEDFKICKINYDNIKLNYEKILNEKVEKCKYYSFEETSTVYFLIHKNIGIYIQILDKMLREILNFENLKKKQISLDDLIIRLNKDINYFKENMRKIQKSIYEKDNRKKQLEAFITDEEIKRKIEKLEEYKIELEKCRKNKEKKISIQGGKKSDIQNAEIEINKVKEILDSQESIKKIFTSYLLSEINEKIIYFGKKNNTEYQINSISELENIFNEWEEEKSEFKSNLITIVNKVQTLANDVRVKLKRWKLEHSIIPIENTKFNDTNLNNRFKISIELNNEGQDLLYKKINIITTKIESIKNLIDRQMEKIIKNLLSQEIGIKLIEMIKETSEIIKQSSEQMEKMNTPVIVSMKLEIKDEQKKIKDILQKSISGNEDLMFPFKEDFKKYILNKLEGLKDEAKEKNEIFSYEAALKEIFDYRKWFNLKIYYQKRGENRKEVTDKTIFSGGEKAMIIYLPILSAIDFKYSKASPDALKVIAFDEAFSVSDDESIRSTMKLIDDLDFDFIFNSPEAKCLVPNTQFNIYTLNPSKTTGIVRISFSTWNGNKRIKEVFSEKDIEELSK